MKAEPMKSIVSLIAGAALFSTSVAVLADGREAPMTLSSTTIAEGQTLGLDQVFAGFGCEGGNMSPDLAWSNAPEGTESFVLTVYDPDAPTGSGWWHWTVANISPDVSAMPAGAIDGAGVPDGAVELRNDYGAVGFGGACPPPGEVHRYQFTLYAMPALLEIDGSVSNALVGFMTTSQALASATITAVYNR
jgi:Raf kinase inhibitor-like YbhB/YbcL family protein